MKKPVIFSSKFPLKISFKAASEVEPSQTSLEVSCGKETSNSPPFREETIGQISLALRRQEYSTEHPRSQSEMWREAPNFYVFRFSLLDDGDRELVTARQRIMGKKGTLRMNGLCKPLRHHSLARQF